MAVTPANIAVALGVAAPESNSITEKQWQMWIDDAAMLIDDRKTQLEHDDDIDEAKLDYVIREAVVAHVRRPDDATQVTVSVDEGSSSKTFRSGKGRVTILDEWWTLLGLVPASGAFGVDMLGLGTVHLPWCASLLGANYCSCGADLAGIPIFEGGEDW